MLCSRANLTAWTLPSIPRTPKPPGTRIPSRSSRLVMASSPTASSEGTQRRSSLTSLACAVAQRLDDGQVGVGKVDVLAHHTDGDDVAGNGGAMDHAVPIVEVRLGRRQLQRLADHPVETAAVEHERDLVDVLRRRWR